MTTSTAEHTGKNQFISAIEHAKVLVVDDNVDLLRLISIRLKPMKFELRTATSAEEALSIMSLWRADLVISDLQMPGMSGMELFEQIHAKDPLLPVIILTAHGTIPEAVEATQSGVASYLTKPFDSETLVKKIEISLISSGFSNSARGDKESSFNKEKWRNRIISKSPLMEAVMQQVETLANGKAMIAFDGEPGTGKDELARAMHSRSDRADKPLVHLACTSIPASLLEAEVFGRLGNGSGGNPARDGLLKQAEGGTLLLSDFNESPPTFRHKVLQALVANEACPIDSEVRYPVDVRAMTTTTAADDFSKNDHILWDLASELGITGLSVPPLRDRREDIPLIIQHALQEQNKGAELQFSNKAMQQMLAAEWPGNVRHLINVVKQCVRLTKTKIISDQLVSSRIGNAVFQVQPLTNAHRDFEREYLTEALKVTNGNVTKAASLAKRNRTEFHRLLKKHKIEAKSFRQ